MAIQSIRHGTAITALTVDAVQISVYRPCNVTRAELGTGHRRSKLCLRLAFGNVSFVGSMREETFQKF